MERRSAQHRLPLLTIAVAKLICLHDNLNPLLSVMCYKWSCHVNQAMYMDQSGPEIEYLVKFIFAILLRCGCLLLEKLNVDFNLVLHNSYK